MLPKPPHVAAAAIVLALLAFLLHPSDSKVLEPLCDTRGYCSANCSGGAGALEVDAIVFLLVPLCVCM